MGAGTLFQERFKSEAVETDSYFFTVLRYIHQNPIKAKIVKDVTDYKKTRGQGRCFRKGEVIRQIARITGLSSTRIWKV